MDFAGKRALVTGGSSGIGLEITRELLSRGARAVINGRRAEVVDRAVRELKLSGTVSGIAADVTTAEGRREMLEGALEALGGLDILVNNAGGVRAGRLEAISEDEVQKMVDVNLIGPIFLTRAALPALRESGDSIIVNVSSGIGLVAMPFYAPYAAVKAGIAHFGEALRRELAGEGVRVLTIYPTATDTPMMATSGLNPPDGRESPADVARETVDAMASGRLGVVRGSADRLNIVKLNRTDPASVDEAMRPMKDGIEAAARDHIAL
jgi:uncharacterized oxidoreductase